MGGAAYQSGARSAPPVPRNKKPSDWQPKDPWNLAYEMVEDLTAPYSPGDQADDALFLGYGSHGRMGEDGVDMDDLRRSFRDWIPANEVVRAVTTLLALLAGEEGDDSDDADGPHLNTDRGLHVFAPGAEDDPETL